VKPAICIHGHFYQPPRENPWLDTIELQDTAHPYHNWNEKISAECYSQNSFSRILNEEKKIRKVLNNYSYISFNIGPTLINWLRKNDFETYQAIIDADKISRSRFSGHGSAIAQAYNHIIMPLANRNDKITQVKWGIADFVFHFDRYPEGMWLPETAVDIETLEILAENNIKFTILAPHQVHAIKQIQAEQWQVKKSHDVDVTRTYLCKLPSGNHIHIFIYNGAISHAVGFGTLLNDGKAFAERLVEAGSGGGHRPKLVSIATDGETFGHHHRFGDMALAFALNYIYEKDLANLTIYGEYLEKYPAEYEIQIHEFTSWSCPHGVKRWFTDCGCNFGIQPGWNQKWRLPLRTSLDWLRDQINQYLEIHFSSNFKDFWRARNDYALVMLNRQDFVIQSFLNQQLNIDREKTDYTFFIKLMELQRLMMLMYTSCGWFFDDIGNIESVQVLRYAVKTLEIFENVSGQNIRNEFYNRISEAVSNLPDKKNALYLIENKILPGRVDVFRAGIHFAISLFYYGSLEKVEKFHYSVKKDYSEKITLSGLVVLIGRFNIKDTVTLEPVTFQFIALEKSSFNVQTYATISMSSTEFDNVIKKIKKMIADSEYDQIPACVAGYFKKPYSLNHLFKDEQTKIAQLKLNQALNELARSRNSIFFRNLKTITFLSRNKVNLPIQIVSMMSGVFTKKILEVFNSEKINTKILEKYLKKAEKLSVILYVDEIEFTASGKIYQLMNEVLRINHNIDTFKEIYLVLEILDKSYLELDIWKAQNIYFKLTELKLPEYQAKAGQGDKNALEWISIYKKMGTILKIADI
jgi:alpha-amylase/alpha-mannosidase (GH57 family)